MILTNTMGDPMHTLATRSHTLATNGPGRNGGGVFKGRWMGGEAGRVAALLAVVPWMVLAGCSSSTEQQHTAACLDSMTIKECECSGSGAEKACTCITRPCQTGRCTLSAGGKVACIDQPSSCDPALPTQTLCQNGIVYSCEGGTLRSTAPCEGTCMFVGNQGICSATPSLWPACDPALPKQSICSGNELILCQYGYRVNVPGADSDCGSSPNWHCESDGRVGSCVRNDAPFSESCKLDDLNVPRCLGNYRILCLLGRILESNRCKSCTNGVCGGGFGFSCVSDDECASGMVCASLSTDAGIDRDGGVASGGSVCTVPCDGPEEDNPACLAAEVDPTLPFLSFYGRCREGFCRP